MSASPTELLVGYESSIAAMKQMLTIVPPEQRDVAPAPSEWNARQVLLHIADSEILAAARIRQLLAEPGATLYMYDQAAWAERLHDGDSSPEEAIALAMVLRRNTLNLLKRQPPEAWERQANHAVRGPMTLAALVQLYIGHIENHTRQLEEIAATL
ncbi:MAG: DinB family protein [Chloroflexaceae bacterium]|jgi:hypothetical protein|nr:DinB family protein [Chloroflexaceae bacterium]